jgi:hypothetical protein
MYVCMFYVRIRVIYTYVNMHMCTQAYAQRYTYTHIHIHVHKYTFTYTYTDSTYTHIHNRFISHTFPSSALPMKYAACICTIISTRKTQSANTSMATLKPHCTAACVRVFVSILECVCMYVSMYVSDLCV